MSSSDRKFRVNLYVDPEADPEIFELLREVHPRRRAERLRQAILAGMARHHQPFQARAAAIMEAPGVAGAITGPTDNGQAAPAGTGHMPGNPAPVALSAADASLVAEELGHLWE